MSKAIETLMNEHRVIELVLTALETAGRETREGVPLERARVAQFADFFKNFADTCHHGKEEDLLFKRMADFGFPNQQGPIAVMLFDHQVGREHVGVLHAIGAGSGPVTAAERTDFIEHAEAYVPMLRQHILKEDQVLYPMAIRAIPEPDMAQLAAAFDDFESRVMGAGVHQGFHLLADTLIDAYRVKRPAAGGVHPGCGCHAHA
jgi:hemerythrin-like domain-containing protein